MIFIKKSRYNILSKTSKSKLLSPYTFLLCQIGNFRNEDNFISAMNSITSSISNQPSDNQGERLNNCEIF